MMKLPDGPFLELCFYFSNMTEASVMHLLVKTLLDQSAEFAGIGKVHQGKALREKPFDDITDSVLSEIRISSINDVDRILDDENTRLIQILMNNATGANSRISEIITFLSISTEAAHYDRHPIGIWTEGELLSGNFPQQYPNQAAKFGRKIYQRFVDLITSLNPDYAAITSEWALECPYDLRRDPRSISFINFYINRSFIGDIGFEKIQKEFFHAYQEAVADGIYISGSKYLNPIGIEVARDQAERKSILVGKIIAGKALLKRRDEQNEIRAG